MRTHFLVFLLSIYGTNGHGQHGSNSQTSVGGQPHISRKMEDHVDDINHIRKDLQGQINKPTEHLTAEEKKFYYFKLHDTNNDNRLDGLEVMAAFKHEHQDEELYDSNIDEHNNIKPESVSDEELINIIDDILKEEDLDNDGYISYEEFKHALESDDTSTEE
ncbi:unnamed protein product [Rotaria sp. Silwood1]|nr:unnamed protein product [Rotaria sp. Silwood1]CAF1095919.1 unnamed protein product [Rotaria sp. Silwood1]CAF1504715.1 unnamed protein product [Rotaria sp. Silwood1]CAF1686860.1 unnamed protein product [Rotaria sp. Silwood1]CAF3418385.1 unnamed protein product [Rotaria sp. Silwood1]